MRFRKDNEFKLTSEIVEVEIPNKKELLQNLWNTLIDHSFTTTGPNDGHPISVIRSDDIFSIINDQLKDDNEKIEY
jgi:hypothetical protein